jgi:type IV pilus assembly protein PilA
MHQRNANYSRQLAMYSMQGFTLIELLVSIIIIGILAAIALPSYLNQAAKARGSEAKSTIAILNRAQLSYRVEKGTFSTLLDDLDVKASGKFYSYGIGAGVTSSSASVVSTTQIEGLQAISGGVFVTNSGEFRQTVCHSDIPLPAVSTSATPTSVELQNQTCPNNYSILE